MAIFLSVMHTKKYEFSVKMNADATAMIDLFKCNMDMSQLITLLDNVLLVDKIMLY